MTRERTRSHRLPAAHSSLGPDGSSSACFPISRRPQPNKPHRTPLCSPGRLRRASTLAQTPHLLRERWLELADIQGADQRDAVRGNPILFPGVFAWLPREAAAQLHHGGWRPFSCPEADAGSVPTGHLAAVHASRLWSERVLGWPRCASHRSLGGPPGLIPG